MRQKIHRGRPELVLVLTRDCAERNAVIDWGMAFEEFSSLGARADNAIPTAFGRWASTGSTCSGTWLLALCGPLEFAIATSAPS